MEPVPLIFRFYIYGIQGFCDEVVFTAAKRFYRTGDWKLEGDSSISSFFIYGCMSLFLERLYVFFYYKHGLKWYFRLPLYTLFIYTWEHLTGSILRLFDACPWDYSHHTYNLHGLITMYYAPCWMFLGFLQDMLSDVLLRARISTSNGAPILHADEHRNE